MSRAKELGHWPARHRDQLLVECHPLVATEQRGPRAVADVRGNESQLVAAGLALHRPSAEVFQSCEEKGTDVVGLETPCRRLLHLGTDRLNIGKAHDVRR